MIITYSILIFIFGTLLTSFFHVVALRLPNKESISGRSYCPSCHHQLRWVDIIPVLGFIINKGKCHFCKLPIPLSHLITEILGGLLYVFAFLSLGFNLEFIVAIIMISVLMIESISDGIYMIVIDRIWMIGILPIIVIRIIQGNSLSYALSAIIMFSMLYLFAWLGQKLYQKEALGGGDVKLYLFIGFCLTYQQGILSLFLASLFGLIYGITIKRKANSEIALVPFIFVGVIIAYFFGDLIIDWYLNLLGA
ncbi:MAG: prepilin peptidase [Acholeplasmataceae bacterium]|nr:prepilin peptidase [Acholeplasmataceae bacterium]